MAVYTGAISLKTKGSTDVQDITPHVDGIIDKSKIRNGIASIFCPSSTRALTTIEFENGCISDLRRLFDEILPVEREYAHNARWGDGNGHSHVRAALLGPSLTVPFVDSRLTLGTWQQIIYLDFDNRPRDRRLVVQVIGE